MSDEINDGGPAFAQFSLNPWGNQVVSGGMSLRDYFAAAALPMAYDLTKNAVSGGAKITTETFSPHVASLAYDFADAMLKARKAVQP